MTDTPSAELLARYYRGRDEAAAEELFRRYSGRLTALARSRLSQALATRVDPEDVVQSAYRSFFLLARDGEVLLRESGDLWRLLARITLRKVYRSARRHRADCRSVEREHPLPDEREAAALSREPTPAEVAALLDELRGVLAPLGAVPARRVQMRRLEHAAEAPPARRPRPPVAAALRWVAEAAEAIEYAHGVGVVHCDLKPSNLLLGGDGHVRVSDFGLARSLAGGDASPGGTAGFMPPEQFDPEGR